MLFYVLNLKVTITTFTNIGKKTFNLKLKKNCSLKKSKFFFFLDKKGAFSDHILNFDFICRDFSPPQI